LNQANTTDLSPGGLPRIEFWFDFASPYSYLAAMRIEQAAQQAGLGVAWKPMLLGPVFKSLGIPPLPLFAIPQKGEYIWKDLARQADKFGLPWVQPSQFPRNGMLAERIMAGDPDAPWTGAFCRAVFHRSWGLDQDIGTEEVIADALREVGIDPGLAIARAGQDAAKLALRQQTEHAVALGIFGAPMMIARGELFWGNDRLDDAIAHAAGKQ
jgi:2-hydroxychromene-2-carboxylate isomerase